MKESMLRKDWVDEGKIIRGIKLSGKIRENLKN